MGLSSLVKAATFIDLGTAESFSVLAGSGITNTGPTIITGDVGSFPTTTQTGFGSVTLTGTNHAGDGVTQSAKTDLTTAYNNAAAQGPTLPIVADLWGQTLTPGVYNSASSIGLTGTLTLDGGGDPNAIFVFQAGSTLTTASSSVINLVNGTQPCNVFWQIGSSATLGTNSTFRGNILALTSVTLTTGATVNGRILAQNGAVTLDTNTIPRSTWAATTTGGTTSTTVGTTITDVSASASVETELPNTSGAIPSKQSVPWNGVILVLASISTVSIGYTLTRKRQLS